MNFGQIEGCYPDNVSETPHQRSQRKARERKRARREEQELRQAIKAKPLVRFQVMKEELLRILIAEGYAPEDSDKIVCTGHGLDYLAFTVDTK